MGHLIELELSFEYFLMFDKYFNNIFKELLIGLILDTSNIIELGDHIPQG